MQVTTQYALNAKAGAFVVIRCTIMSSRMDIAEDGGVNAGAQQGIIIQKLTAQGNGQFTAGPSITIPPDLSLEPYTVAGYPGDHPPNTVPIGNGGSGSQPAGPGKGTTHGTAIFQATSASATPTTINVTESS